MRKTLPALLLSAALVSLSAGCSKQPAVSPEVSPSPNASIAPEVSASPESSAPAQLDLEAVYEAILDAQGSQKDELILFPEDKNGDYVSNLYPGLGDFALKQLVVYVAPVTGWATEIVLAQAEDEGDVQAIADIFQARIDMGADDSAYPETAAQWERRAQVQTDGCYVGMIVLPEEYTIPENVFALPTP